MSAKEIEQFWERGLKTSSFRLAQLKTNLFWELWQADEILMIFSPSGLLNLVPSGSCLFDIEVRGEEVISRQVRHQATNLEDQDVVCWQQFGCDRFKKN